MKLFTKLLDEAFDKKIDEQKSSSTTPRFTPSTLGAKCERKVFYEYIRAEKKQDQVKISSKRAMVIGRYFGEMYADLLEDSGLLVKWINPDGSTRIGYDGKPNYEFEVSAPELGIKTGFIDAVIVKDRKIYLGENKAISEYQYKELSYSGISQTYYYQCLIYLYLFTKALKEGKFSHIKEFEGITEVESLHITYFNKGQNTIKELVINKNDADFKKIIQRILKIKDFADKNVLPPKTEDYCNYCPFRHLCDKNLVR